MKPSRTTEAIVGLAASLSLIACLGAAVAVFLGVLAADSFKSLFLVASILWFGVAGYYALKDRPDDTA